MLMDIKYRNSEPELWGGLECTINRVNDVFNDQLERLGHYDRPEDIEHILALGLKAIRYPVLWEKHQPDLEKAINWSAVETNLKLLSKNNVEIIAGLLHHGSGPAFTNLLDPHFPGLLADYAEAVAKKFPFIKYYTPVNEPLTTARFSGLYGHWYPHHKNDRSFARILINEIKAVALSMERIRTVNPDAKLIQTEDIARIHSSEKLKYQARFENKRRWLTYDLLTGMVTPSHPFWKYFLSNGIQKEELQYFIDHPCVPDVAGFNYYVTSERYLDDDIGRYPSALCGGNGLHQYVDTEAVRKIQLHGLKRLMREAWKRYGLPLAVTETHINCTREEQLRWFKDTWDQSCDLKREGVDIRAVTAWSLFGAYDWDSLLTRNGHHYESGAFTIRNNKIKETAVAKMIRSYALNGSFSHPVLNSKGWWHTQLTRRASFSSGQPLIIAGKTGTLGSAFARICADRSICSISLTRKELDITSSFSIETAINKYKPWGIINAAGYVKVDDAEVNKAECFAINSTGPGQLAELCRSHGIKLMTFSSDLVFDGKKQSPYIEEDETAPLNVYGKAKAKGEQLVMAADPNALIIRTSSFFGPWDKYNFAHQILLSLNKQSPCFVVNDVIVSPTYLPDLVHSCLDLFIDDETGIWHVCNDGMISWADFAGEIAERAGFRRNILMRKSLPEMGWRADRPLYSPLINSKGITLPSIEDAISRYFEQKISV